MLPRTLLPLALITFFAFTFAQSDSASQGLLECSAIEDTAARLACYDALANDAAPPAVSSSDNWSVSVDTNPVDDTKTVTYSTGGIEGSTSSTFGDDFSLILRCRSASLDAYIVWNDYLGSETTQVTYRIGTAPAKTDTWYISTDGQATFFSQNEPANRQFIDSLVASDNGRLVAQVTPYNESTSTAFLT
jgi:type VI secretion system protein VasI